MTPMKPPGGDVTELLRLLSSGDPDVRTKLFDLIYDELRRIAAARMKSERSGHTLTPTALVHEAYLRLAGSTSLQYTDRAHFVALVAQAMRRVLVDHARAKKAAKRDAAAAELPWMISIQEPDDRILAVDKALEDLAKLSPRQSQVIELRYFAGLTEDQIASVLGVTRRTVCRDWQIGRAWLYSRLQSA